MLDVADLGRCKDLDSDQDQFLMVWMTEDWAMGVSGSGLLWSCMLLSASGPVQSINSNDGYGRKCITPCVCVCMCVCVCLHTHTSIHCYTGGCVCL